MPSPESPPYTITPAILSLVADIAGRLGRMGAISGADQVPTLRRANRIRSIHASLAIENNTLTLDQVTAVISGKRILGPPDEIQEVRNAFATYEAMPDLSPVSSRDLLAAHKLKRAHREMKNDE
jgi:Fic family protein